MKKNKKEHKSFLDKHDISDEDLKILIFEFYELLLKRINIYKYNNKEFYLIKFIENYKNSRFLIKNMKPDFLHEFIKPFNFYQIFVEKLKNLASPDEKIEFLQSCADDINDMANINFIKLIYRLSPNDRLLDRKYYSPFFDYLYMVCKILLEINLNIKDYPDADYIDYTTQVRDFYFPIISNTKDLVPELISKKSDDEEILSVDELENLYVDDAINTDIDDIYKSIKRSFA